MIREIFTYPDPILHRVAKPIDKVDDEIRTLLDDIAQTMYAGEGVGLAASQVGEGLRAIVVDIKSGTSEQGQGLLKMVNPKITAREGEVEWEEGCLSVPDFRIVMKRSQLITVKFLDYDGKPRGLTAMDLLAVAIQHEIDHLDGKLIIDKESRLKRDIYLRKRKKTES